MDEDEKVIKKGDIFLVSSDEFLMYTISKDDPVDKNRWHVFGSAECFNSKKYNEFEERLNKSRCKNKFSGCVSDEDKLLFAVKYLGNGIVEEMTTGLKIQMEGGACLQIGVITYETYEDGRFVTDYYAAKLEDYDSLVGMDSLGYNGYKEAKRANSEGYTTKGGFAKELQEFIYQASNYPLLIDCFAVFYPIDNQSMRKYLRDSDSTRKEFIKMLLGEAKEYYSTELFPTINSVLEELEYRTGRVPKETLKAPYPYVKIKFMISGMKQ